MDKNQFVIKFNQIVKSKLKNTFSFDDVKKLIKSKKYNNCCGK